MTIAVTTISNGQSFGAWLSTTNRLANIVSQNTVTADSTGGGSITTGNSFIYGYFGANYLYAVNGLSGGNVSSNGNLSIVSNVLFTYSSSNLVTITANSSKSAVLIAVNDISLVPSGNATVSGNTFVVNTSNVFFSNTNVQFTNSPLSGNITFTSNTIYSGSVIISNGSFGTNGDVLYSNGSGMYWSSIPSATGVSITANNTSVSTFYLPMSESTTGAWSNAIVSSSKLYFVPSTGDLNATNFNSLSDQRKKTNIKSINDSTNIINALNPVEFNWIESENKSSGFIAQEIEEILPHLVSTSKDGTKSLNYMGLLSYIIRHNQLLQKKLETLESKLGS